MASDRAKGALSRVRVCDLSEAVYVEELGLTSKELRALMEAGVV